MHSYHNVDLKKSIYIKILNIILMLKAKLITMSF